MKLQKVIDSAIPIVAVRRLAVFLGLCILIPVSSLVAQENPHGQVIHSEVKHVGSAEVRSVTRDSGFFPSRQPKVYWHDESWTIDLLPPSSLDAAFQLRITSGDKRERTLTLPDSFAQIDSITRAPGNEAVVIAEIDGKITSIGVVDLPQAKLIDNFSLVAPAISPEGRFIAFVNTDFVDYYDYRLYDTLKTPSENTCGYRENDPEHKDLDEAYRGFPIYPRWADHVHCDQRYLEAFANEAHLRASDFVWSSDTGKVVFADVKSGALSLILVTTPKDEGKNDRDRNGLPQTSIYTFTGADDVCAGASTCDNNNVKSVAWNGDSINVALIQANPGGPKIEKDLTVPLTQFVALSGDKQSSKQP